LAKTSAKIFEAVSLDGSSANERTPRAFFSETATRGDGDAKRDREESAFRGDERAIEHGVWLSSERQDIVARSRLEKRSRQRKRTRRELRFVSKKRSLGTGKRRPESAATTFCVRGKKIARSKTFHPNRISLWVFRVVSSAQNSRRRRLTSHTKSNILSCFFSSARSRETRAISEFARSRSAVAALFRRQARTQLHAPRRSRAMSARTGWKRTADGRMMRSESAEDVMEEDEPSMLLDRVPAHVLREVFGFLGDSDLARAEATCATFRQASRSESLWRDKLADKLGDQAKIVLPEKLPHERYARARRRLRRHRISLLLFSPPRSGRVAPRAR
jgi:hypothetical protein